MKHKLSKNHATCSPFRRITRLNLIMTAALFSFYERSIPTPIPSSASVDMYSLRANPREDKHQLLKQALRTDTAVSVLVLDDLSFH